MADNTTFNSTFNSTNGTNGTDYSSWQPTTPRTWADFWIGLLWPVLYITILVGSLSTFSSLYRKRQIAKAARLESWFPPHRQRDIYLSLLHLDPQEQDAKAGEKTISKVPDNVLKAALLKRAVEDIQRIVQLRSTKPALQTLMQRGSIGDDLWQRFLMAEKEMEEEVKDVANAFSPNWGQVIFQSANEINQNRLIKERIAELQATTEAEKAWWDEKKSKTSASFMKELDDEAAEKAQAEALAAAAAKAKNRSSDEDTVLVESGGPGSAQGSMRGKKKGGKK
ncbi:Translocation protein sec66 [Pseudocercospora fuligena]|uniref:Translocation protein sec66 n=1 Tax=Pseudocercospora fuligena TaxID=685502 RepID=A0A8H6R784_9PEZI|nr:Translocation protein sec66 [Pseudocercospora fuligena]